MEVLSGCWRSDLALAALEGAGVEHHPTSVVVRPAAGAPGGLLLLRRAPVRRDLPLAVERLRAELPGDTGAAIGLDDPTADDADLAGLRPLGFTVSTSVVLTAEADALRPSDPGPRDVHVRPLGPDADWAARSALLLAARGPVLGAAAAAAVLAERTLAESGRATWLGAWEDDELVASVGVVLAGDALARLGAADARRPARARGVTTHLVRAAAEHARDALAARTVMVVADAEHAGITAYERLGFAHTENQVQARVRR